MHRLANLRSARPTISLLVLILIAAAWRGDVVRARRAQQAGALTIVSAATFEPGVVAPESIASLFGEDLAQSTEAASGTPLPITLAGIAVRLRDSLGVEHQAPLFFVSPQQINFLVPPAMAPGEAVVTVVSRGNASPPTGEVRIAPTAPGLFSANANGSGAAQGFLLRAPRTGGTTLEPLAQFDERRQRWVPRPLQLIRPTLQGERLFFVLFGTGIRRRGALEDVKASVGGLPAAVQFAGAVDGLAGLDQINVALADLPIQLTGRGRFTIAVTVAGPGRGGGTTNTVEVEAQELPGGPPPTITGFEPARVLAGETLTIRGTGFRQAGGFGSVNPWVRIGGVEAAILDLQETEIRVRVPYGAESGPVVFSAGPGSPATSSQSLTVRTSISGVVEDTRRRPIPGLTVRLVALRPGAAEIRATTSADGVFTLADVDAGAQAILIDGASVATTPPFPQLTTGILVGAERDNLLPRPIALQQATGARISLPAAAPSAAIDLQPPSSDRDWVREPDAPPASSQPAQQPGCASENEIRFDLPANAQIFFPCPPSGPCPTGNDALYVSQIENSRTPARLPLGHYAGTMAQLSPTLFTLPAGGILTMPNTDCLPPNSPVTLFGLAQALRAQGKKKEAAAAEARFSRAWAGTDVTLTASRF